MEGSEGDGLGTIAPPFVVVQRSRANSAHVRQSTPYSGPDLSHFQTKGFKPCKSDRFSLGGRTRVEGSEGDGLGAVASLFVVVQLHQPALARGHRCPPVCAFQGSGSDFGLWDLGFGVWG